MILAPGKLGFDTGLPEVLSASLIASHLGVTSRTVRKWRACGYPVGGNRVYLPAIKAGKSLRVARADYIEFLRRINPDIWQEVAEQQDAERRQAKREAKKLRERRG